MTLSPTAAALCSLSMSLMGNYPKKLKVNVLSKGGEKIMLEVNPMSNVGELRNELQKVRNQGMGFGLPEEGYFFIYKQNVMEEDQSFRWHRVAQGDTIEIFNGCVTDFRFPSVQLVNANN
ncbi:ubiquitin family protein [Artemisia annua]|uniref:Ubiquitin family protein n=1 Tax=Artemisia annua TaxID=35608 RepID=A0A2U1LIF3_ARTAN|nr:ubiquitin family protein [Artemisia annua]